MLPLNLVLIRHGLSTANEAKHHYKNTGDDSLYTEELLGLHSNAFPLSTIGIEQAYAAGDWLRREQFTSFQRYYTSEHRRAFHTAALLNLQNARWYRDQVLRERDHGIMDNLHPDVVKKRYAEYKRELEKSPFYAKPANGESIAETVDRLRSTFMSTLHRECSNGNVIVVAHGEVLWALRFIIERMSVEKYEELDRSEHPHDRMNNCQILQYTRVNPNDPSDIRTHPMWMRSVCPWDETRSPNIWQAIVRKSYTNEELLALVKKD
jgi:NAD+ kinase